LRQSDGGKELIGYALQFSRFELASPRNRSGGTRNASKIQPIRASAPVATMRTQASITCHGRNRMSEMSAAWDSWLSLSEFGYSSVTANRN
jgi:hypothetical protein